MKKITLTRKIAHLQMSIDELVILKNALVEVCCHLGDYEFETRVNISKEEANQLAKKIQQTVEGLALEQAEIEFNHRELWGLRGALNNYSRNEKTRALLDFIGWEIIEKMEEGNIGRMIFNRDSEIQKELNFKFLNLKIPRVSPQVIEKCYLEIGSYTLVFLLGSLKYERSFCGIQVFVRQSNHPDNISNKSLAQKFNISYLLELIAYFEVYIELANKGQEIESFIFCIYSFDKHWSEKHCLFDIQVLSGSVISEKKGFLQIKFQLNLDPKKAEETPDNCLKIEELASFENIQKFTSSLRQFLTKLKE